MNKAATESRGRTPVPGKCYGNESLRYALLVIVFVTFLWSSVHFFLSTRTLREDLAQARKS